jgi:hypothetical protein
MSANDTGLKKKFYLDAEHLNGVRPEGVERFRQQLHFGEAQRWDGLLRERDAELKLFPSYCYRTLWVIFHRIAS